jgi:hypothetical protein
MHRSKRRRVHELPDCIGDPPPNRGTVVIARLRKFFRPYRAFYVRLIAVALQHQVGDAPDVDFRDRTDWLSGKRGLTVNAAVVGDLRPVTILQPA